MACKCTKKILRATVFGLGVVCLTAISPVAGETNDIGALNKRFEELYASQDYGQALAAAQQLKKQAKKKFGTKHLQYALALHQLGRALWRQERFKEATTFSKQALAIREAVLGPNHIEVALTLNILANLMNEQGDYQQAEALHQRALAIRQAALGPDHADVAQSLGNLAVLRERQGDRAEALVLHQRALSIREKALGENHIEVALNLTNLASLYEGLARYGEALPLYERALAIYEQKLGPNSRAVAQTLHGLALVHGGQGRYGESAALYQRAIAIKETVFGPEHFSVALTLENLALIFREQGRYGEAETALQRTLAIKQQAGGADDPAVAQTVRNIATVYLHQDRIGEAEQFAQRALAIQERSLGPDHSRVAETLSTLSEAYYRQGRYGDVEGLLKRALNIAEKTAGASHPDTAALLNTMGVLYEEQGRHADAEVVFRRALAINEKAHGVDHPDVADVLNNFGNLYLGQERLREAETFYRRTLAIREKALGDTHPEVAGAINNLAAVIERQNRYAEAEALHRRALTIREQGLGPTHAKVAESLTNLAVVLQSQGRYAEAEASFQRGMAIREQSTGLDHPAVATDLYNLAGLYQAQRRYAEAEQAAKRALDIRMKAHGDRHPSVGDALHQLANLSGAQGRFAEAEGLFRRALTAKQGLLGDTHPSVTLTLNGLSKSYSAAGDHANALAYSRKAAGAFIAYAETDPTSAQDKEEPEWFDRGGLFRNHVSALAAAAKRGVEPEPALAREALQAAQWAKSSTTAAAMQQMASRLAAGSGDLVALVRESQDLAVAWRGRDASLMTTLAKPEGAQKSAAVAGLRQDMAKIEGRRAAIAARLERDYPDYAALALAKPLKAEEVQASLGPDEALVYFLTDHRETHVFALTREGLAWRTIAADLDGLADRVGAVRRGLFGGGGVRAVEKERAEESRGAGFDLAAAHELYRLLLGPVADAVKDKAHWIIVPDGPLTGVPFQLLLTAAPTMQTTMKDAPWLIREHAVSMLPAVSSLRALRKLAPKARTATLPFIGFGDPVIGSAPGEVSCAAFEGPAQVAGLSSETAVRAPLIDPRALTGGGLSDEGMIVADVEWLRRQPRLAEARCEIEALARRQRAEPAHSTFVGAQATEDRVKALSTQGELKKYRVVAFATHGLLPSEAQGVAEAGLILTPPERGTAQDDGLLTASEVAALELDADWVILSACNTAAGEKPGAETLSGLARAFFFAGARSVLVSHWPVESRAAVLLTTRAFAEIERAPAIGKAEAMRRAMLSFLADDAPEAWSHPRIWAPFSLVGEGGAS